MSSAPGGRRSWLRSALLFVLVVEGALILWSLDLFHREVRGLTDETSAMRLALERLRDLGPRAGEPSSGVPQGDGLVVAGMAEPGTLNRYAASDGSIRTICNYLHDGLIALDPDSLEPAPGLATSWELEPGGAAIVFRLRQGVVWSDGSPFTADDVLYTYAVLRDPGVPGGGMSSLLANVKSIERVPPDALRFVLQRPSFRALTQIGLGFRILCASWWNKKVAAAAEVVGAARAPAPGERGFAPLFCGITEPGPGTGPYVFDPERSWQRGAHVTLRRNPTTWWKTAFPARWNLASIRYRFLPDAVGQWEELAAGKVDLLLTADDDRWQAERRRDPAIATRFRFVRYDHPGLGHIAILWNCRRPPFDDVRVRRALTMLVDRETIVNELFAGQGPRATCVFKPGTPEYSTDLEPLPFGRDRALAELATAGWTDTADGLLDSKGAKLSFVLAIPSQPEDYRRLADTVVASMQAAGIRVTVERIEWSSFRSRVFAARDFDAACVQFGHSDVLVDPFDRYHSSGDAPNGENACGLRDLQIDSLLDQARAEPERSRRVAIYHQFNHRLHELQPHTLIRHPLVAAVVSARYRNAEVNGKGLVPEEWYVPAELQRKDR